MSVEINSPTNLHTFAGEYFCPGAFKHTYFYKDVEKIGDLNGVLMFFVKQL